MPAPTVPYSQPRLTHQEMIQRAEAEYAAADTRRTVRMFSTDPVPQEVIEYGIKSAGTAPSGAHHQPWHFCAISDPDLKQKLREAAEVEEKDFYERRAPDEWKAALEPLGTDFVKEHLTDAPWLIIVFREDYSLNADGSRRKNYYMTESVGIAVGFLIQALHRSGVAMLTHTPAPMTFLRELCGRPKNEKPFLILAVGYPADECEVPDLARKSLEQIADFL